MALPSEVTPITIFVSMFPLMITLHDKVFLFVCCLLMQVGLGLLLCPLNSNIVLRTAWYSSLIFGVIYQIFIFNMFSVFTDHGYIWVTCYSCSVGLVLPVYSTFKAIENKDPNEQHRWLLYWAGCTLSSTSISLLQEKNNDWLILFGIITVLLSLWCGDWFQWYMLMPL